MFTDKRYYLLSEFSLKDWGRPELFLKKETFPDVGDIEYVDLDFVTAGLSWVLSL